MQSIRGAAGINAHAHDIVHRSLARPTLLAAHREISKRFDHFDRELSGGFEGAFALLLERALEAQEFRLDALPLGADFEPS